MGIERWPASQCRRLSAHAARDEAVVHLPPAEPAALPVFPGRPWNVSDWRGPLTVAGLEQGLRVIAVRWAGLHVLDYENPVPTAEPEKRCIGTIICCAN